MEKRSGAIKVFLFGTGNMADNILRQVNNFSKNIEILGFIDNDSKKWGEFWGRSVYPPSILLENSYDILIIMSDVYFDTIKDNLVYWYDIDKNKIKNQRYLLKMLLMDKYKNTEDSDIKQILKYLETNEISVYNQYVEEEKEIHTVYWDRVDNLPYIWFEDKKMYFPYDYKFQEYEGKKVVKDINCEQQLSSPHLYIKDDIKIERGDVIVDAGVQEGNFSLRYIEKVSKAYLFECSERWIRPLQKTFEKFKDKVILCDRFLGRINGGKNVNLDSIVMGRLDFLKMDVEGAEVEALLGAKNVLLNNDVKCSICSYHKSGDEEAIKDILSVYGYRTETSSGYIFFYLDENIYSNLDFRRGIVYAKKWVTEWVK